MSFVSEPELGFIRVDNPEEIILREYQEESILGLRTNIHAGIRCQILASMVGSGKTVMGAYLLRECWQKERRGMFVVDRNNLLDQTSAVFDRYGIPHGIIQSQHPRWRPGELIQVASIQTLARRGWPMADLIIADEVHVVHKTMVDKIKKDDAIIVGLTATPFTRGLGRHYKAIVNVTTGNKLTAEGFLVPFLHEVWEFDAPDMTGAKVVAGEWTDDEASKRGIKIVGSAVDAYLEKGQGRKMFIYGADVAHCEALQCAFLKAGINVGLYTYHTDNEERDTMMKEFRKPDSVIRGLVSVAALARGTDVPDVGVIVMCRPLKNSFAEFVQILGRGLRGHSSKKDCVIIDHAGNFRRHLPALIEFIEEGVNELDDGKPKPKSESLAKKERKPLKCPKCSHVFMPAPYCPACGYIFPKRMVNHEEGTLIKLDAGRVLKMDRAAKIQLHGELTYICHKRGYKPGWISWRYKSITGVWPSGMPRESRTPSEATLAKVMQLARPAPKRPVARLVAPAKSLPEVDLFS